ncbi:MAG: CDP-diacylglycerol--serine O-phosphatidyltransferase [Bacteroidales bacterium]|nr:CDP-diacylglycerol--serine O-phosphatidyltransferase [Bacteroidales bacterium]
MNIKKHIPNAITLGNLTCGCISLLLAVQWQFQYAALMVLAAAVFDFFDGFAARMLHTKSDIGKELDSLCDMISFGLAPAFIMYYMLSRTLLLTDMPLYETFNINIIPAACSIIYACCVAVRLAKFNLDTRQTEQFLGLPSPAAAFILISTPFWHLPYNQTSFIIYITVMALLCAAMLCEYPLLSLKFHDFTFKNNAARYALVLCSIALITVCGIKHMLPLAIIPIMLVYIILSIIENHKTNQK